MNRIKSSRTIICSVIFLILISAAFDINSGYCATVLKFSSHYQIGTPAEEGMAMWAKLVKERTSGRIEVQHFPASQLGNYKDMVEQCRIGSIQGATTNAGGLGLYLPEFSVLVCPFLFRDDEHYAKVVKGDIGKELSEKLAQTANLRPIAMNWYWGKRHITSNKAIYRPENLKGLKIRTPDSAIYVQAIKAMGATPTPMAITEVYSALQTGTIDGQENPIDNIKTYNLQEVQKYVCLSGHILELQINFLNEKFWKSLSNEDREIILKSMEEAENWQNAKLKDKEMNSLVWLQETGKMIVTVPDSDSFVKAANTVFPGEFGKDWGPLYQKIKDVK
jgi:TRAP-type transport system periplasmic protein